MCVLYQVLYRYMFYSHTGRVKHDLEIFVEYGEWLQSNTTTAISYGRCEGVCGENKRPGATTCGRQD